MSQIRYLIVAIFTILSLNCTAQISRSDDINFFVKHYTTERIFLAISKYDTDSIHLNLLTVTMKTTDGYRPFPKESRLLLKFDDDSIVELNSFGDIIEYYRVEKEHTLKSSTSTSSVPVSDYRGIVTQSVHTLTQVDSPIDVYYTGRDYVITEEVLQKLFTHPIVKMRVELDNGDRQDYEESKKQSIKLLKKLQLAYKSVESKQKERIQNVNGNWTEGF
jgi:hypothetical protein